MNSESLISLIFPVLGLIQYLGLYRFRPKTGVRNLIIISAIAFIYNIWNLYATTIPELRFGYLLASLISFITLNIQKYADRYLDGDSEYAYFFIFLSGLQCCATGMVLPSNSLVFWAFWSLSNLFLVRLMIHKSKWEAAKNAGLLALGNFIFGSAALGGALLLINSSVSDYQFLGKVLLIIAAMSQSAIFPLHRWLLSSLNSPTPVSALMHAGIVNAGGILLIKYQYLFIGESGLLNAIFLIGLMTALLGGFWKLLQFDIKKMLANSTMAQMGFMFLQCGLGLFPAALAHLCWHGLFKAYLFLNSGSALQTKFKAERNLCSIKDYFWVIVASILAITCFVFSAHLSLNQASTQWILVGIVGISAWQLSKNLVGKHHLFLDLFLVIGSAAIYGLSIRFIEACLGVVHINGLPLNPIYIAGLFCLVIVWLVMNSPLFKKIQTTKCWAWLYMSGLNASQPSAKTLTSIREKYDF